MTGYDSGDDTKPENIAMLALAVFSTSYNLPIYLHYNSTFRRAYLRMFRFESCHCGTKSVHNTRIQSVADNIPKPREKVGGSSGEQRFRHQLKFGREPQNNKENEPSTSQDNHSTHVVNGSDVLWARRPNTEQLNASDSRVVLQRY